MISSPRCAHVRELAVTRLSARFATTFREYGNPHVMDQMIAETQNASPDYATLPVPKNPAAAKQLSAYVGTYTNEYFGTLEVALGNNRLILRLPPRGAYYELSPWDGDTFTYYFASESTGLGRRGAKFSPDKNQVLIENLAAEHNSVFTRRQ